MLRSPEGKTSESEGQKTPREKLSERFELRFTPSQMEELRNRAARENTDIADVLRKAALASEMANEVSSPPDLDESRVDELRVGKLRAGATLQEKLARRLLYGDGEGDETSAPSLSEDLDAQWLGLPSATLRLRRLASAPCGPWKRAVDEGEWVSLPKAIADTLDARAGDVVVPASGDSMREAGILDGYDVVMRPYDGRSPKRGDIVLIQVWMGSAGNADESSDAECVSTMKYWDGLDAKGHPLLLDGKKQPYPLPETPHRYEAVSRAISVMGRL